MYRIYVKEWFESEAKLVAETNDMEMVKSYVYIYENENTKLPAEVHVIEIKEIYRSAPPRLQPLFPNLRAMFTK